MEVGRVTMRASKRKFISHPSVPSDGKIVARICWLLSRQNEHLSQMCSLLLAIFAWLAVHICHRNHDSDDFSDVILSNVFISLHSNSID